VCGCKDEMNESEFLCVMCLTEEMGLFIQHNV
jgi:hypothetical protein